MVVVVVVVVVAVVVVRIHVVGMSDGEGRGGHDDVDPWGDGMGGGCLDGVGGETRLVEGGGAGVEGVIASRDPVPLVVREEGANPAPAMPTKWIQGGVEGLDERRVTVRVPTWGVRAKAGRQRSGARDRDGTAGWGRGGTG